MSTGDDYIQSVLALHAYNPGSFVSMASDIVIRTLRAWAGVDLNRIVFTGSVAKGTAISGATDLDIFISLQSGIGLTLKDIYERLYSKAETEGWNPRRQNVSIGISYLGVQMDLVPGRLQSGYTYYHSLWKRKQATWQQSAPELHVDQVKDSQRTREIRAMKVWRKNHCLDFPSFYLELTVMKALIGCSYINLASNFLRALKYIASELPTAVVEDPANTNNIVSDDLTPAEKRTLAAQAKASLNAPGWGATIW